MKTITFALVTLALLLVAAVAGAGTIVFRDPAGALTPAAMSGLQAHVGDWPFAAHVLVEAAPDLPTLEDDAHAWVDSPNVVVIAIDPSHHRVVTRFGSATGVKTGDFDAVSASGSVAFRAHDLPGGIEAILLRARASREASTALTSSTQPPVIIEHGLTAGTWVPMVLFAGLLVGVIVWLVRRARRSDEVFTNALEENRLETSELRSRNIHEEAWADVVARQEVSATPRTPRRRPATSVPLSSLAVAPARHRIVAPQPQVIVQQRDNLVDGMLLGEMMADRGGRDREVVIEREVNAGRPSVDVGGASSSYDAGSTSSYQDTPASTPSSYDSGGASTSYDPSPSVPYDPGRSDTGGGGESSW